MQPDLITAPAPGLAGVEECFATVDGLRLRYLRAGAGPPLVLIHGLIAHSFSWRFNLSALARRNTCFALDLPGMGYSDRGPALGCRLRQQAERVLHLLDGLKIESATVLGSSHGGGVSMTLAAIGASRVSRLVLVAPVNPWSRHGRWLAPLLGRIPGVTRLHPLLMRLGPLHRKLLRRLYGDPRRIAPGTLDGYVAPLRIPGTLAHVRCILHGWRDDLRELERILPQIAHIPTLLIWGSRDRVVSPASAQPLLRNFQHAELAILEGAGHVPYEEVPEEFNRVVLDFLSGKEID